MADDQQREAVARVLHRHLRRGEPHEWLANPGCIASLTNTGQSCSGYARLVADDVLAALAALAPVQSDLLRAGVQALATGYTDEMEQIANRGEWRALWVNLRTDLRVLLAETEPQPAPSVSVEQVRAVIEHARPGEHTVESVIGYLRGRGIEVQP